MPRSAGPGTGFLSLGITGVWGWTILCCWRNVGCLSASLVSTPLETNGTLPPAVTIKLSPNTVKLALVESH